MGLTVASTTTRAERNACWEIPNRKRSKSVCKTKLPISPIFAVNLTSNCIAGVCALKVHVGFFALSSLKNKIFLTFLLLILLPYAFLQFYSIRQIEQSVEKQVIEQNNKQLEQLKLTFEDLRGTVFRIAIRLEKDPVIISLLSGGGPAEEEDRRKLMDSLWNDLKSNALPSPYVFYSITDLQNRQYASYIPGKILSYKSALDQNGLEEMKSGKAGYVWVSDQETDLRPEDGKSPRLVTLYSQLHDERGREVGLLRIGIDFQTWLSSMAKSFPITQDFFLLNEKDAMLGGTGDRSDDVLAAFIRAGAGTDGGSHMVNGAYLYNRMPIPAMKWTLVSRFPLQLFFGDIEQMKQRMVSTFLLFTLVFVVITFFILSTITRPLRLLQKKMAEVADKQFQTHLPTRRYKGELLAVARAFNKMVSDVHALLRRLKEEERQKEAVRFQMLLSQMNPHFLLNTLNVVKWNVLSKGDEETAAICMSLGRLLETSLNEEADLIHFRTEKELTEAYVSILSFRYDQHFELHWECDERIAFALVPKLSLQPLVENAIFHGLSNKERGGAVWIRAYAAEGRCYLEVEDNGAGWNPATAPNPARKRKSIGLTNIKERLELLFKKDGRLDIEPLPAGTRVKLGFPLLMAEPYTEAERGSNDVERTARGG
ncbi:hypothetical protein DQG23_19235 [Paenibacillus contaminans]|uniref:HAMP domain-containing protein n=1 Tax=Paenibacillus contaminans TaxID=450362 RepID=A0A329MJ60_9BACL|nr:hypothetical protein DQG23_19235 [Paenibacillus contaminans]